MDNEIAIFFDGALVGWIVAPKLDNFDMYGKWLAEEGDEHKFFLARLDEMGEVEVQIGQGQQVLIGTIEIIPRDEVDIKIK